MSLDLQDMIGTRGEKIAELALTDFSHFPAPLFRPGFLGDKWPSVDLYVELAGVTERRFYFFGQVKTTTSPLTPRSKSLRISTTRKNIRELLKFPGPTYILGVHEPSKRVFIRSVHQGTPDAAITRIPLTHEVTGDNLRRLHHEVENYWISQQSKPSQSVSHDD